MTFPFFFADEEQAEGVKYHPWCHRAGTDHSPRPPSPTSLQQPDLQWLPRYPDRLRGGSPGGWKTPEAADESVWLSQS